MEYLIDGWCGIFAYTPTICRLRMASAQRSRERKLIRRGVIIWRIKDYHGGVIARSFLHTGERKCGGKNDKTTCVIIGEQIMLRRKELDISQEELAYLTGISRSQISRIERAYSMAKDDTLERIEIALEVEPGTWVNMKLKIEADSSSMALAHDIKDYLLSCDLSENGLRIMQSVIIVVTETLKRIEI